MIEYNLSDQSEIPEGGDFSVKVIGVGGAGANVLDRMTLEGSNEAELLTLNTDERALSTSVSNSKIQLGKTLLMGMGAGGDPELGKQAALEAVDEIRAAVRGHKMVFVCVGLGGGTGSGAGPEVCRICKEEGVFLVVFTTLPFKFEGQRRLEQALTALDKVSEYANAVITFENDRMGELLVPKSGVQQAFAAADNLISQSIRATMAIVQKPGLIRIGMDDILAALEGQNSRCLFGHGVAKGDNRANEALNTALKSPLLDQGRLLENASNVLVHISGGDSMTMAEVETLMEALTKHISDNTQILFGTSADSKIGDAVAVTIISSLSTDAPRTTDPKIIEEAKKPEPPKEETQNNASDPTAEIASSTAALAAVGTDDDAPEMEETPLEEEDTTEDAVEAESEAEAPEPAIETAPESENRLEPEADEEVIEAVAEPEPEVEEEPIPEAPEPEPVAEETIEEAPEPVSEPEAIVETEDEPEIEAEAPIEEPSPEPEPEPAPVIEEAPVAEADPEPVIKETPEPEEAPEVSPQIKKRTIVDPVIKPKSNPVIVQTVGKKTAVRSLSSASGEDDGIAVGGPQPVAKIGAPSSRIGGSAGSVDEGKPAISIRDLTRKSRESLAMDEDEVTPDSSSSVSAETGDAQRISLTPIAPKRAPEAAEGEAQEDPHPRAVPIVSPQIKSGSVGGKVTPRIRNSEGESSSASLSTPPSQSIRPPSPASEIDPTDEATAKQQQMLQLEPLSKGRFAKTEPTIVDGEDMDVPTFLRKRKK